MKPVEPPLELERLLASEESELAASLSALRERGPDAAELASLASRLALQGVQVSPPSALSGAPRWKKWAAGGAGSAATALLWLGLRSPQPVEVPAPQRDATSLTARSITLPVARPSTPAARDAEAGHVVPGAPAAAGDAVRPVGGPALVAEPAPVAESAPVSAASPLEPLPRAANTEQASPTPPEPAAALRPSTPPSFAPAGSSREASSSASPAEAPSEMTLLRDARLALRQSPARALELTEQHARLYPAGKLTQERELMAISALVALGRRTAALSRAAGFEKSFPGSPYRKQVGELLH